MTHAENSTNSGAPGMTPAVFQGAGVAFDAVEGFELRISSFLRHSPIRHSSFICLALWSSAQLLSACSVPVFRYALDHWRADPFRLEVPQALMNDSSTVRLLRPLGVGSGVNVEIATIPDATRTCLLRPDATAPPLWAGKLDEAAVTAMAASPARSEIVSRILAGHSLVWVLAESSDKAASDAAAATIEKRLAFLKNVTQLPVMDPGDPSNKLGPGPELKVHFSLLRVRGDDPAEQLFLNALAGPKPQAGLRDGPWLATVFGRGRVLGAWPAKGFGDAEVDEVCLFLLGACSCQVKNLNPGWDLLLGVDWDTELMKVQQQRMLAAEASAETSDATNAPAVETVSISGESDSSAPAASQSALPVPGKAPIWWLGAALLLVLGGAIVWRRAA